MPALALELAPRLPYYEYSPGLDEGAGWLMRSLRLFFVAVLACGGCESYSYYGSGPITLTPEVQAALDEYMKHPGIGGMFAVSSDGTKYSAVHCDRCASLQRGYYLPETVREALGECNQQRNNNDCKIYAIADRIVWH